jgi:hypothetical protein
MCAGFTAGSGQSGNLVVSQGSEPPGGAGHRRIVAEDHFIRFQVAGASATGCACANAIVAQPAGH